MKGTWESVGGTALGWLALLSAALQPPPAAGLTVVNPHDTTRPDYCLDCHTEEVYRRNCDEVEGFCLLADSVDGLCLLCHVKEECCRTGQEHQAKLFIGIRSHPSGIATPRAGLRYAPKSLPLHDGHITCRTCHLHARLDTGGYRLLRIVEGKDQEADWTVLCADCHEEKF